MAPAPAVPLTKDPEHETPDPLHPGRSPSGASAAASADKLSIGFADPLSSLDPQLNNHAGDRSVALHFWDLLIENKWNKLQPGLAVSWKPLDDKTWEFKLREGVKWQDGTPFTADDLIYSYTRARAVPGSVATYAGYLRTIDSMSAKDPLTLIVKTKAPNPDLPLNLASVHVVSKHVGENPAPRTTTRARPWSAPAPTSSCPTPRRPRRHGAQRRLLGRQADLGSGQLPLHQQRRRPHRRAAGRRRGRDRQSVRVRPG